MHRGSRQGPPFGSLVLYLKSVISTYCTVKVCNNVKMHTFADSDWSDVT